MADTRQKNGNWLVRPGSDGKFTWSQVQAAVLMDIRDELQRLNELLHCSNAIAIPRILKRIATNTAKPRKKRK